MYKIEYFIVPERVFSRSISFQKITLSLEQSKSWYEIKSYKLVKNNF